MYGKQRKFDNLKLISVLVSGMKEFTDAYWTQQEKCMNKATSKTNKNLPKLRWQRSDNVRTTSPI